MEGAVSSEDDFHKIKLVRQRTKRQFRWVTARSLQMSRASRNPFATQAVYDRAYRENVTLDPLHQTRSCPGFYLWRDRSMSLFRSTFLCQDVRHPRTVAFFM